MKRNLLLAILSLLTVSLAFGQTTVSGVVTSTEDGEPIPGVSVTVKATILGVTTDGSGNYTIDVPADKNTLVFSYIGMQPQSIKVDGRSTINVALEPAVLGLDEVIVTAIGIGREKKSLGYAAQEVSGEEVSRVKDVNFMNSLSGKVAGVNIRRSNQMGGSANVIIRGYKSLTGNNQPLFVVDGTPISNSNTNTTSQETGRGGYDFGNAAMDINPEDVESISVLKGAAATALYGSRAANGVVMITTKKGSRKEGIGITVNSSYIAGTVDQSTMPRYQNEYGGGYGAFYGGGDEGYFEDVDIDGDGVSDGLSVPMGEDASYGGAFDPSLQVYTWESVHPELSTFGQKFPFTPTDNTAANSFYETATTWNNTIALDGGSETSAYRFSFTNLTQNGIMPNSRIARNTLSINARNEFNERLTLSTVANYVTTDGRGRYGTGYDNRNPNQSFRQWYNVATDMNRQWEVYDQTGLNLSWNPYGYGRPDPSAPHYFDNYYFNAYENFSTDERNRIFGNVQLDYKLNDWLSFLARFSMDNYSELQEQRIAVGSVDVSMYGRYNRSFNETNTDLLLNMNKYFGADDIFNFSGTLGANFRRTEVENYYAQTNGGLIVPGVYSITNSLGAPFITNSRPIDANNRRVPLGEQVYSIGVNGYFVRASLGYDNFLYLDLTGRYDISSTLPEEDNAYFYPSASLSFVFSEIMDINGLDFGKIRLNYASVGASAPAQAIFDTYVSGQPFMGVPLASVPSTQNNSELLPENTNSLEAGLELNFLRNRAGLDFSVYQSSTFNQIIPVSVSATTGQNFQYVNAGEIQNRGMELALFGSPIRSKDFDWTIRLNWSQNRNEVVELFADQTNLQLASVQGGITINATVGEPYGAIWGTNFVYHTNGEPIVYPHPFGGMRHRKTSTPEVIGNIQPDWNMGINNALSYKDFSLSFLIDIQKGGNFFSLDTWYGYATGIYDITAGTNDKGNPVRMNPDDGGGIPIGGVVQTGTDADGNPISDGTPNEGYAYMDDVYSSIGYVIAPNAYHVYDASYVKLREVALSYSLPSSAVDGLPFTGIDISLIGRNLWIIDKNTPYSDPEAGLSAGNIQGYQSGAWPAVKEIGVNLRVTL